MQNSRVKSVGDYFLLSITKKTNIVLLVVLSHVQVLRFSPSRLFCGGEWTSVVLTQRIEKLNVKKKERGMFTALSTLLSSPFHIPFSISVCVFLSLHVSLAFSFFFFYLPLPICFSLSLSLVLRTCRWHGAWPDKVIPQCRGLPGRDSLDTVSPLLAGGMLQREGRPELEWGGKRAK